MIKQVITTALAPQAIGTYSQAIKVGNIIYFSGQIGLQPETGEMSGNGFKEQLIQIIANLKAIANAAGGDLSHIVKITVYVTNLTNFPIINEVMEVMWPKPFPARAAIEVSGLPKEALVEVDAIMHLSS